MQKNLKHSWKRLLACLLAVAMLVGVAPLYGIDILDFKAKAANYKVGDIIEFGSYPQTQVTDSALISSLNSISAIWRSYGYMSGSGSAWCDGSAKESDYMKYKDVTYNNERYRAVEFSTYRPGLVTYKSTETCFNYQVSNNYKINNVYWFKFEPIQWKILDPNKGLVLCNSIIDSQPFNNNLYSTGNTNTWSAHYWKNSERTISANDYMHSDIKEWLNDDFYYTAFTESNRKQISSQSDGKVTLLGKNDITNTSYGFINNESRKASGTDYAKAQGLRVSNGTSIWMTQSAASSLGINISCVHFDGHTFDRESNDYGHTSMTYNGVRPALYIDNISEISWKEDKVKIEFRFADTKKLIDTSDEYLADRAVGMNFHSAGADVSDYKSAKNGILYLEDFYFPLDYVKAEWQSAFAPEEYIFTTRNTINAKAGDTIVFYLSCTGDGGSMSHETGDGEGGNGTEPDGTKFPSGYDFNEDSYNFENYTSMIPYGYFKTMYGKAKGYELWKNEWFQGGLCFGFSYTTAAFNNSLPPCSSIRGLSKSSKISIGNNSLSVDAYIKYAHLYQFSMEFRGNSVWSDVRTIYDLVKQTTNDNVLMVTIGMSHKTDGGHRVLAIGIDGNDILIDDPNSSNEIQRITINDDGSWSFSGLDGWNSETCAIRYSMDISGPYKFLRSLNTLTANEAFIDDSTIDSFSSSYEADTLSEDNLLLAVNSNEYNITNTDVSKIEVESNDNSDSSEQTDLYWLTDDKTVTVTGITEDSEIELVGNDNIIGVATSDSSSVELTVDEESDIITTSLDTSTGNDYTLSSKSFDENSNVIALTVSGTASSDTVTATQTEAGLVVTGISDGTVTLSKDDEVIETQTISNATSDIEIAYDKTGESEDISLDYETPHEHSYSSETVAPTCTEDGKTVYTCSCGDTYSEEISALGHTDTNADGKCDNCGEIMEAVKTCTCNCHKTGFAGFIYKIMRIFWKLFRIKKTCACGMAHY